MIKFLTDLIARKKAEMQKLQERVKASENVEEVRALGDNLLALRDEITEAETKLAELEKDDEGKDNGDDNNPAPTPADEGRSTTINPLDTYKRASETNDDERGTMEYRKAFKDYVQNGNISDVLQFRNNRTGEIISRATGPLQSSDLGVLLPSTVVQEILSGVEKKYGMLYGKVRKLNVKGGIKFPIGSFGASFKRIGETGAPTERQKAGSVTGFVEFSYKIGEIRISQTLLESVLTVPAFEAEVAKVIIEAYVQAMDNEILNGSTTNEMEGILTEVKKGEGGRVPTANIIELTDADMKDWKSWQKKLFAKIPLSMRSERPEFVMTANTFESNIKTLVDENNRPLGVETFNPTDGAEKATFKGREVSFIEEGLGIANFDDAENDDVFGFYWVPSKAFAINTNLEFATKRYWDEEKLEWVERAVVINDGKILDPNYLYILKKKVTA
jgi:HK97 family phage major capsid protein